MKNVTKILTAAVLCAALFASDQRINALGGNAALWPGDEANIAAFPAQMNNHAYLQVTGVGEDCDPATGACTDTSGESASILFQKDGTTWGMDFNNGGNDWFNINWGNGDMGVSVGMRQNNTKDGAENGGLSVGWGKNMSWGEIGVSYATTSGSSGPTDTAEDATTDLGFNWRSDGCSWWVFDSSVAGFTSSSCEGGACGSASSFTTDSTELSWTSFTHMDAGAADVVWGMGFTNSSSETCSNATTCTDGGAMTLDNTLAVEANMTDWATFRLGATHSYQLSGENDYAGPGTSGSDNGWALATGFGFNWGGFTADYTVSQGFFNDPVSNITGYDNGNLTNQGVTLTYGF